MFAISQHCQHHPEVHNFSVDQRCDLPTLRRLVVDKKHRLVLCQVPKAAGSFWRTMLIRGTGKVNEEELRHMVIFSHDHITQIGLDYLSNFSREEQAYILKNYLKVMIVRNPMERVLSAYIDKFVKVKKVTDLIMPSVMYVNKKYRNKSNKIESPHEPSGVTLEEFVNLVIDPNSPYNVHWDSATNLCHPCDIHYDHIIRTETIAHDSQKILEILSEGFDKLLELEIIHSERNNTVQALKDTKMHAKALEDFQQISKNMLERLKDKYHNDMDIFGYNFDISTHEAFCAFNKYVNESCC